MFQNKKPLDMDQMCEDISQVFLSIVFFVPVGDCVIAVAPCEKILFVSTHVAVKVESFLPKLSFIHVM